MSDNYLLTYEDALFHWCQNYSYIEHFADTVFCQTIISSLTEKHCFTGAKTTISVGISEKIFWYIINHIHDILFMWKKEKKKFWSYIVLPDMGSIAFVYIIACIALLC